MAQYPENMKDELEAYPLRLDVAALPDRRFFKMTRTLTIGVVLLTALLLILGVFLNYQITHLDVTVRRGNTWQFYHIDPVEKKLKPLESARVKLKPLRFVIEEKLRAYIKERNSTVWNEQEMNARFGPTGLIAQMSHPDVYIAFGSESKAMLAQTRGSGLVRDVHIYELTLTNTDIWMAIVEIFDLPMHNDWGEPVCACSDNSKSCLDCKIEKSKRRERYKIWIRTSFRKQAMCEENKRQCEQNPLGVTVEKYVPLLMPIHPNETFWDLPPALRPEI